MIVNNLKDIKDRIEKSANKCGKTSKDITIVGVTKTINVDRIKSLLEHGIINLGENKVQEFMDKYLLLNEEPIWHFIGRLQTNKVKYIVDKVSLIHSVDSIRLAEEINKRAMSKNLNSNILIEVNIANDRSKAGVYEDELKSFIQNISKLSNIKVKGLMTVVPFVENPEKNRDYFRKMRNLFLDISNDCINNIDMKFLSMGMTNDFEVAIEEGANIVRIGQGIFGTRNYS